jgi:hypothetical protein
MIANGKELYKFLDSIFIPNGYIRKKDTYYKHTEECICYFTIGKSPFGGRYDHAMGGFYKPIYEGGSDFPPYHKDHLRYSLEFLTNKEMVRNIFDLEKNDFKENEREHLIRELIELYVLPFLDDISSREGIKRAVDKYDRLKHIMQYPLMLALGISFQ